MKREIFNAYRERVAMELLRELGELINPNRAQIRTTTQIQKPGVEVLEVESEEDYWARMLRA